MNKTALKNFAVWARESLINNIKYVAGTKAVTENGICEPLPQSTKDLQLFDIGTKNYVEIKGAEIAQRNSLVAAIKAKAEELNNYKAAFQYIVEPCRPRTVHQGRRCVPSGERYFRGRFQY